MISTTAMIMTELLKRRRKLAAVRLQITAAAAPEVERLLCRPSGADPQAGRSCRKARWT